MKKEAKKLLSLLAVGALAFSLVACGMSQTEIYDDDVEDTEWESENWDDTDWDDTDWEDTDSEDSDDYNSDDEKTEWEINQEKESMIESYWVLDDNIDPVGGDYTFYTDGSYMFGGGGGEVTYGTYEYTDTGLTTHSDSGYDHEWTANDAWDTLTSDEGSILYLREH